ncbi:MAG: zinc-binding dehydrogenase [Armatimonadota bacterium]
MQGREWVVVRERELAFREIEVPEPGAGQVLLRTEASLVSAGTELAIFTGIHQGLTNPDVDWPKYPQGMGYMAVARVEQVGPGVEGFRRGDRLLTSTGHTSHRLLDLSTRLGGHLWPLPDDVPAHRLVLARMGKTAITAVCQAGVTVAQSVVVVGLGIIGQMTLRLFVAAGAYPVVGIDPVRLRREAALRGGAVGAIDPASEEPSEALQRLLPGGADIVIDATGWAEALPGALKLATEGGTVVVLGSPRGTAKEVDFYSDLHRRSLRVVGAHDSGLGREVRRNFPWTDTRAVPALVHWVRTGHLPVEDLITHHVPPSALPGMYAGLLDDKERYLGVVLDWTRE